MYPKPIFVRVIRPSGGRWPCVLSFYAKVYLDEQKRWVLQDVLAEVLATLSHHLSIMAQDGEQLRIEMGPAGEPWASPQDSSYHAERRRAEPYDDNPNQGASHADAPEH